jgi:hypothetical protein
MNFCNASETSASEIANRRTPQSIQALSDQVVEETLKAVSAINTTDVTRAGFAAR